MSIVYDYDDIGRRLSLLEHPPTLPRWSDSQPAVINIQQRLHEQDECGDILLGQIVPLPVTLSPSTVNLREQIERARGLNNC